MINTNGNGTGKRAVLYARVSSDDRGKDGRNLKGQLEMCRDYAEEHGWHIVAELAEDDRGASGASFDLPKLTEALDMAAAGDYDALVVRELDRLSRNLAKQLVVEEQLKRAGVSIAYVLGNYDDTPEGALMKNVRAVIAEYERLKIAERMTRGRRQKVKAGNVMAHGSPPYGYKLVDRDGKRTFAIIEEEAAIVRLIFEWYTVGDGDRGRLSTAAIARKLTDMRAPTYVDNRPGKGEKARPYGAWSTTSVHSILTNETYAGTWYYGKRGSAQDGRRVENDDDYWLAVKVPAIVSPETWATAEETLARNKRKPRNAVRHEYLLRGHAVCGHCGNQMGLKPSYNTNGKVYLYYRCLSDRRYGGSCDNAVVYPASVIDPEVWRRLKRMVKDPTAVEEGLERVQAEQQAATTPERDRLAVVEDLLADHRAKLERALDLYLAGEFGREMLADRRQRLEHTIAKLEQERDELRATLDARTLTPEELESFRRFCRYVAAGIDDMDGDFAEQRDTIDMLNLEATMYLENGEKQVKFVCYLGEDVLSLASSRSRMVTVT